MANQPKKYKKFVATAATATLVASAIVPVASAASLSDIKGNTHEEAITSLVDAGVINGYPDGTFQPNKTLTRSDVVKLLGKYLVSKGLEVPADYKTNVRFNDLTSASNDELLKYAAVVYDAGVFSGSNGNLLAGDNITRENMAVVLVRAFDTLNNIDLVSYVQGQEYKKDVKDLFTAKAEARAAIEVLDFFDITNPSVANFNPKGSTTRGQFATFLYKTINTDFSAVTGVANSAVSEIKAVNNTTVEVTFKETVENIESLDFKIEGLEVKNAVVKQTDAKTVVLTTAAQTGDTVYTLNVNAAKAGTFKGVSAVIPTAVTMTTASVQGKLGQQVTVKAQVTVAEGQSKAGIPVTLFVPGSADGIKAPVTVEAVTNAEGVATYTYTRYAATTDTVTAYASGDRSKFATGYVFWGVDTILSIEEVTTGDTINNGANKTYKVTYKNDVTGKPQAGVTLNVSALENINVTADKAQNVTVNGTNVAQFSNNTVTRAAQIVTDANGQATFTVSGNHATVTPVVFVATPQYNAGGTVTGYSQTYSASALQTTAPKVTFAAVQAAYTIEMTREGGEIAATGASNGGREYKVVVKDKSGKLAANEIVNVAFNEDLDKVIATETDAQFIDTSGTTQVFYTGAQARKISVKTNSKGEATFVVGSTTVNDYATPIAWIDINTANASNAQLDNGEPTAVGPISHFQQQYVDGAAIAAFNGGTKTTKFTGVETATFKASLTNQSGLTYNASPTSITNVTYTLTNTGGEDVEVNDNGTWRTVSPNRSISVSSVSELQVKPVADSTSSVKVTATGNATYTDALTGATKTFAFTSKEATASFTKVGEVPTAGHTGVITSYNTTNKTVTFAGKNPVKYAGETDKTYVFKGLGGATIPDGATGFLAILASNSVTASYTVDGDTVTFAIQGQSAGSTVETGATEGVNAKIEALTATSTNTQILEAYNAYNALSADQKALVPTANVTALTNAIDTAIATIKSAAGFPASNASANYTSASWSAFGEAYNLPTATLANKAAALIAFAELNVADLVSAVNATSTGLVITFTPAVTGADVNLGTIAASDVVTSTVGATATAAYDATTKKLTVTFTDATPAALADGDTITITVTVNGVEEDLVLENNSGTWTLTGSPVVIR